MFGLDRVTFNNIVKASAIVKQEKYDKFLKKVTILNEMNEYERSHLCDAIKIKNLKEGE